MSQSALVRAVAGPARLALTRWDRKSASSAVRYVANSTAVAARIASAYGVDADVVHPPSSLRRGDPREPVEGLESGYLLSVGRGRGYKNIDVVASAMKLLPDDRLVVVGGHPGLQEIPRIRQLSGLVDKQMRWLYANAKAVVSLSFEDFGLTPVEGFTFGIPAVVLRAGGFLDSMVEGVTGTFADDPTPESFARAVRQLPGAYNTQAILQHAEKFSPSSFKRRIREVAAASC